jgi:hypothetical protein
MKPGIERPLAIESIERPDGGQDRLLGYVLGCITLADDAVCGSPGSWP